MSDDLAKRIFCSEPMPVQVVKKKKKPASITFRLTRDDRQALKKLKLLYRVPSISQAIRLAIVDAQKWMEGKANRDDTLHVMGGGR